MSIKANKKREYCFKMFNSRYKKKSYSYNSNCNNHDERLVLLQIFLSHTNVAKVRTHQRPWQPNCNQHIR